MKKLTALFLVLVLLFAGCGGKTESSAPETTSPVPESSAAESTPSTEPEAPAEKQLRIGIAQLVQHEALDASRQGFIDALAAGGYVDGQNIVIDYQNAQGEIPNTTTVAAKLVNDECDLILAIATPQAQAVANATNTIPVLVTAVTDPADAQLVTSNEAPGGNVTGTSDMSPVKEQIELLHKIAPDAKIVGVLFNSGESNSRLQADMAIKAIEDLGLTAKEFTISEASQIQQVTQAAVGEVDALYTPTDNMIASGMPIVATLAMENKIPLIGGEKGQVDNGALATYGLDYYELGKITGEMAIKVLEGANPGDMPIQYQTEFTLTINPETLAALGITLPQDLAQ